MVNKRVSEDEAWRRREVSRGKDIISTQEDIPSTVKCFQFQPNMAFNLYPRLSPLKLSQEINHPFKISPGINQQRQGPSLSISMGCGFGVGGMKSDTLTRKPIPFISAHQRHPDV